LTGEVMSLTLPGFTQIGRWYKSASDEQQATYRKLFVAVTAFSAALYANALCGTRGLSVSWLVAAGAAVAIGTWQNYRVLLEVQEDPERINSQIMAVWLGIYALVLCGGMIVIASVKGVDFTIVDVAIMVINVTGIAMVLLLGRRFGKAWVKFGLFLSLKALPQLGQAFLLLAVGGNAEWGFYPVFFAAALYQGKLRLQLAAAAYRAMPTPEANANKWSWKADLFSFVVMAICWAVGAATGGVFPGVKGVL